MSNRRFFSVKSQAYTVSEVIAYWQKLKFYNLYPKWYNTVNIPTTDIKHTIKLSLYPKEEKTETEWMEQIEHKQQDDWFKS